MRLRLRILATQLILAALCVGCCIPPPVGHIYVQKVSVGMSKQDVLETNGTPFSITTHNNKNEKSESVEEWHYQETAATSSIECKNGKRFLCFPSRTNTTTLVFENDKLTNIKEEETINPVVYDPNLEIKKR